MSATVRVGEMLVEAGVINRTQLNEALRNQAHSGGRLGSNLVELGFIDEKTLATFLSKQLNLPAVTAASIDRIKPDVVALLPADVAERVRAVPIREDGGKLWVAMTDPTDRLALAELEKVTRRPLRPMVSPELLMQYALEKLYHVRRKPRIVEVPSSGADLLRIPAGAHAAQPVPKLPASALVDMPGSDLLAVDALEAVTGYLDESRLLAQSVPVPVPQQPLTIRTVAAELAISHTDELVLDVATRFLAQEIPRVWAFLLRNGELWSWGGRGIDPASMSGAHVAMNELGLVGQALASGEVLAGRLQPSALGRLAAPLGVDRDVLGIVLPVRIGKHAVGVIFGVDASLEAMRKKPELDKLAIKVDQALHINYLRRLLLAP